MFPPYSLRRLSGSPDRSGSWNCNPLSRNMAQIIGTVSFEHISFRSQHILSMANTSLSQNSFGGMDTSKSSECGICFCNYGEESPDGFVEEQVITPCWHSYGRSCLENWLYDSIEPSCPDCRCLLYYKSCRHIIPPLPVDFSSLPDRISSDSRPNRCDHCESGLPPFWFVPWSQKLRKLRSKLNALRQEKESLREEKESVNIWEVRILRTLYRRLKENRSKTEECQVQIQHAERLVEMQKQTRMHSARTRSRW